MKLYGPKGTVLAKYVPQVHASIRPLWRALSAQVGLLQVHLGNAQNKRYNDEPETHSRALDLLADADMDTEKEVDGLEIGDELTAMLSTEEGDLEDEAGLAYMRDMAVLSFFVYRACRYLPVLFTPWWRENSSEADLSGMRVVARDAHGTSNGTDTRRRRTRA